MFTHTHTHIYTHPHAHTPVHIYVFSHSIMSDSLQPHGLQHARLVHHQLPELTQTLVYRVSDTIQPSHPLSSPSSPAFNLSQVFPVSQFFASGGQNGTSALASVLPMNIQDGFPLGLIGLILQCKGLDSQESSPTPQFKSISTQKLWSNSHIHK